MDPVAVFVTGLMIGSVSILLAQAFGRRNMTRTLAQSQGRPAGGNSAGTGPQMSGS